MTLIAQESLALLIRSTIRSLKRDQLLHHIFKQKGKAMKIILALLVVAVALPLGLGMATTYFTDIRSAVSSDIAPVSEIISYNLTSEPVTMILVGMGLITIAGIGRKKLIKKDNQPK